LPVPGTSPGGTMTITAGTPAPPGRTFSLFIPSVGQPTITETIPK
jgi:hypothetical protein